MKRYTGLKTKEDYEKYISTMNMLGKVSCLFEFNNKVYMDVAMADTEVVVVPEIVYGLANNYSVTNNGENIKENTIVKEVIVGTNVKLLDTQAFMQMRSLEFVSDLDNATDTNDISNLFCGCYSLVKSPKLPDSAENLEGAFCMCKSLVEIQNFPNNALDISNAFEGCEELLRVPKIHKNITKMDGAFMGCTKLSGKLEIDGNPEEFVDCLLDTSTDNSAKLELTGKSKNIEKILETKSDNSNITIKKS